MEVIAAVRSQFITVKSESPDCFSTFCQRKHRGRAIARLVVVKKLVQVEHRIGVAHRPPIDDDPSGDSVTGGKATTANLLGIATKGISRERGIIWLAQVHGASREWDHTLDAVDG
jgi:hypothetical protein